MEKRLKLKDGECYSISNKGVTFYTEGFKEKLFIPIKLFKKILKNKKINLNDTDYPENVKCPHCKNLINFSYFAERFSTPLGETKGVIEELYNSDINFFNFVRDSNFPERLDENIERFIKNNLKELYKKYKSGKNEKNNGY